MNGFCGFDLLIFFESFRGIGIPAQLASVFRLPDIFRAHAVVVSPGRCHETIIARGSFVFRDKTDIGWDQGVVVVEHVQVTLSRPR
jgi:hypothetical protein